MTLWMHELRLLLRARLSVVALILLAILTAAAVTAGMVEISRQRTAIAAIPAAQSEDIAAVADYVDRTKDAGSAGYYSFHPTWDAPSPLAFAALGMRDVSPYILRVRALGLEAQIYDGDVFNPELALPGRFDFAFVLVFLAPLFVVALFHDLTSGEREAGRLRMLDALPRGGAKLLRRRMLLRIALLWAALAVPFLVAAVASGVGGVAIFAVLSVILAYLLFWMALAALVARLRWSKRCNAGSVLACTGARPADTGARRNQPRRADRSGRRDRACPARDGQPRLGHSPRNNNAPILCRSSRMGGLCPAWVGLPLQMVFRLPSGR
jgi:ABC-2 type transport system permease protein